jgi:phosphoadenosine phosphosulfate reductase
MTLPHAATPDETLVRLPAATVARALNRLTEGMSPQEILGFAMESFGGRIALVSSFGAESAALLHMVSEIDRATPVLFLETGMLFAATIAYQQELAGQFGLSDMRVIRPEAGLLRDGDPDGSLHRVDPDACCTLRKTVPLRRALWGFEAWITGRKRYQGPSRAALKTFEADEEGRIKVNPLAAWDAKLIRAYMEAHRLPLHPMAGENFPSIGCAPCTTAVKPGEDPRAGRWRGQDKDECGIHFVDGRAVRVPAMHEGVRAAFP